MAKMQKTTAKNSRVRHGFVVLGFVVLGGVLLLLPTIRGSASSCTVTDKLVNPCRAWLGAAVNNYPQVASDTKSQMLYHEERIGRQLDLIHTYHSVGKNQLTSTDIYFATRDNTYLFANWKPASNWADAGGGNASTNSGIDSMATSIKSIAPKKIFLTIFHEPENDVSGGAAGCSTFKGSSGTPTDYRNMWQNVRNRFDALGVSNVVWVMDYMNYSLWDCMVNDLYPGDSLVDWIVFNAYGSSSVDFYGNANRFYSLLTGNSNGSHNYISKPWGIVEWSIGGSTTSAQRSEYFDQAKTVLDDNSLPNLKMYMAYDSNDKGSDSGSSLRVAYDGNGAYQADQMAHYAAFANDTKIFGDGTSPNSTPAEEAASPDSSTSDAPNDAGGDIAPAEETNGGSDDPEVSAVLTEQNDDGTITITPSANGGEIQVLVDGRLIDGMTIDTKKLTNGSHEITIIEDGVSTTHTIVVENPLPLAIVNHIRANSIRYGSGFLATGIVLGVGIGYLYVPRFAGGLRRLVNWPRRSFRKLYH